MAEVYCLQGSFSIQANILADTIESFLGDAIIRDVNLF